MLVYIVSTKKHTELSILKKLAKLLYLPYWDIDDLSSMSQLQELRIDFRSCHAF